MIAFLDTSTILAATLSDKGLSRLLVSMADPQGWSLAAAYYCIDEVEKNVG